MSKPIVYFNATSPPCRGIVLVARSLGIDIEIKPVDLYTFENMNPEFLKMNPQHKVPVLVDGSFVLTESRAIMLYLIDSRAGTDCSLKSSDPQEMATIHQRLFFDCELFDGLTRLVVPLAFGLITELQEEPLQEFFEQLGFLEKFLEGRKWFVGENATVADLSILATYSTIRLGLADLSLYPMLEKWYKNCEVLPGFEENKVGAEWLADLLKAKNKTLRAPIFK